LASASGGQDHTILRPLQCRSSARRVARVAKASIASRAQRSWRSRSAPLDRARDGRTILL